MVEINKSHCKFVAVFMVANHALWGDWLSGRPFLLFGNAVGAQLESSFSFTSESYYYMIIPMNGVKKTTEEWLKQADYDLKTAEAMLLARKYIYAIFMCHLAVEKTLKALWTKKYSETPGKTHDLIFLSSGLELNLTTKFNDFLEELNGLSVPTRYPDELGKVLKQFSLAKTKTVYKSTKELLSWLKN